MTNKKVVKIGIIGLGPRAETLLASIFPMWNDAQVTAICDVREARITLVQGIFDKQGEKTAGRIQGI
ncbi:MAG: hypothetical protein GX280_02290 [Lentisphaerae bacterium]|jgi:predicted dehydrogenase|nr:hypothetical protein [Victivallaceae bacterium]NLK82897.1 hypothetical protein [Lentisphaerota bacterium]